MLFLVGLYTLEISDSHSEFVSQHITIALLGALNDYNFKLKKKIEF